MKLCWSHISLIKTPVVARVHFDWTKQFRCESTISKMRYKDRWWLIYSQIIVKAWRFLSRGWCISTYIIDGFPFQLTPLFIFNSSCYCTTMENLSIIINKIIKINNVSKKWWRKGKSWLSCENTVVPEISLLSVSCLSCYRHRHTHITQNVAPWSLGCPNSCA